MIEVQRGDEGIQVIQMARGKVNAMDLEFCQRLIDVLDTLAQDDTVAAILIGNERVFSAGVDLRALVARDNQYLSRYLPKLIECFKAVFNFPKPLVAAISGHAIAGGCVLASACDLRLIRPNAKIGLPELRIGVPLPSAGIEIMRFAVAPEALRAMVNAGQTYQNEEAVRVGLADRVFDQSEMPAMLAQAINAAQGLTVVPPNVYRLSKAQQRAPAVRNIDANEAAFGQQVFDIWHSPENRKVVEQYVQERL